MNIKNWIACVQDRDEWKEVIEKAKTFNQEVQRLEEEDFQWQPNCSMRTDRHTDMTKLTVAFLQFCERT